MMLAILPSGGLSACQKRCDPHQAKWLPALNCPGSVSLVHCCVRQGLGAQAARQTGGASSQGKRAGGEGGQSSTTHEEGEWGQDEWVPSSTRLNTLAPGPLVRRGLEQAKRGLRPADDLVFGAWEYELAESGAEVAKTSHSQAQVVEALPFVHLRRRFGGFSGTWLARLL